MAGSILIAIGFIDRHRQLHDIVLDLSLGLDQDQLQVSQ
jgi:hypothetical protein